MELHNTHYDIEVLILLMLFKSCSCSFMIFGLDRGEFSLQHTQRQTTQSSSSALGALMSFSVKLSDMERQIASYEKTIKRQTAEIDQLRAKLDSKSERSQFQSLQALLTSKMTTINDEINTKDLVIERYRNKLRQLEEEITVRVAPAVVSLAAVFWMSRNAFSKAVVPKVGNLSSKVCPGVENFSLMNFLIFYFFIKTLCSISKEQKHKLI